MSREQASAVLARRQDELDRVTAALLGLDDHRGHKLLAGGELTGETRRRWEAARGELAALWRTFDAYKRVLTRARELAARPARDDVRAELTLLLTGPSVELRVETPPLNRRPLLAPTSETITLDAALARMTTAYETVTDVVAAADTAWTPLLTRLNKADTHLHSLTQTTTTLTTPPTPGTGPAPDRAPGDATPGPTPTSAPGSAPAPGPGPAPTTESGSGPAPALGPLLGDAESGPAPAVGPAPAAGPEPGSGGSPLGGGGSAGGGAAVGSGGPRAGFSYGSEGGHGAGGRLPGGVGSSAAGAGGSAAAAPGAGGGLERGCAGGPAAGGVRDVDVARVARSLEALRRDVLGDPLAFVRGGRCDTSRADTLLADMEALQADLDAARRLRDGYPDRVAALEAAVAEVAAAETRARDAGELARAKILDPALPPPPEAAPDLRVRLRTLTVPPAPASPGTGVVARWRRRAADVAELEREASGAREAADAVADQAMGLVDRRNELRGRLDAYKAKALRYGLAEDEELSAAARRARDLLWTAPCDLRAATRAVAAYVHAFDARRAAGSGGTAGRPGESQE